MTNVEYYPYLLRAELKAKVWGGRNLERLLGKALPANELIGETWEAWEGCAIENGAQRGATLTQLIARDAAIILGAATQRFPLLFKFIDAQDDLSVQVHPDDVAARAMEHQPFGKTEAWYILHAEPGAQLVYGFNRDYDRAQITALIRENKMVDALAFVPVQSGDVIFVPAGTVHAIGKGIVLAEIQQNSDTTYRFYDWDRVDKDRALHIEQSLNVAEFARIANPKIPPLTIQHDHFDQQFLVACRYFAFESLTLRGRTAPLATNARFRIVTVIEGEAAIHFDDQIIAAKRGQTFLLPALLGDYALAPITTQSKLLCTYVPDLRRDVIEPLRRANYRDDEIARLGGSISSHNDLQPLF
ncbi:mannose-6-phosphate isomerase [Anaerolineae bacterium]|nr:mannose-6-phosphate isomerase [Anaerolineae bacterium]